MDWWWIHHLELENGIDQRQRPRDYPHALVDYKRSYHNTSTKLAWCIYKRPPLSSSESAHNFHLRLRRKSLSLYYYQGFAINQPTKLFALHSSFHFKTRVSWDFWCVTRYSSGCDGYFIFRRNVSIIACSFQLRHRNDGRLAYRNAACWAIAKSIPWGRLWF